MKNLLGIAILLACFQQIYAQRPVCYELSFSTALQAAKQHELLYQNSLLQTQKSELSIRMQHAAALPNMKATASLQNNLIIPSTPVPIGKFNNQYPDNATIPIKFGTPWSIQTGLQLTQPIWNPAHATQMKIARLQYKQSTLQSRNQLEQLIEDVMLQYGNLIITQQKIAMYQHLLEEKIQNEKIIRQTYMDGRALKTDLDQARIASLNQQIELEKTKATYKLQLLKLQQITGIDSLLIADSIRLITPLSGFISLPENTALAGTPSDSLFRHRTAYQQQMLQTEIDEQERQLTRKNFLPQINLQAFLGTNYYDRTLAVWGSDKWYGNSYVGLQFSWDIFQGGYRQHALRQRLIQLTIDSNLLKKQTQDAQYQWQQSLAEIQYARQQQQLLQQKIALQQDYLEQMRNTYAAGRATILDVFKAQQDLEAAQQDYLQSLYDLLQAALSYQEVTGMLADLQDTDNR